MEHERALRWEEAASAYENLIARLRVEVGQEAGAMRAITLLRRGNTLMELRRWDDARACLDEALNEAKGSRNPDVVAQSLLAAGVFAANREDPARAEAFLLEALDRFHRTDDRASVQGRGWAFLNLATVYGRTGRLDLAFVTFTKAQDVLGAAGDWAGASPAPPGDPRRGPVAGGPRRGRRLLRSRGHEGEGGPPPRDARQQGRMTFGNPHFCRRKT